MTVGETRAEGPDAGSAAAADPALDRRRFLGVAATACAGAAAALVAAPATGFLLTPLLRDDETAEWVDLGPVRDLAGPVPRSVRFQVTVRDAYRVRQQTRMAWVVRVGDEVQAYRPECTHLGCAYAWSDAASRFECPCHGGMFTADGTVIAGPPRRPLDRFPHEVRDGRLHIQVGSRRTT